MLCGLIRPAFLAARGTLDRWGRGLPLPDLDLGDALAAPLAVCLVHRLHAVGRGSARWLADGATTAIAVHFGWAIGGGLPADRLGLPMLRLAFPLVSLCHPSRVPAGFPSLRARIHCYRMHTLRAAGRAVSGCLLCVRLRGVFVRASGLHRCEVVSDADRPSLLVDDRHSRSVRASAARAALASLPLLARRRRPHHKNPPTARRAARIVASASPSPTENRACCSPESRAQGNRKPTICSSHRIGPLAYASKPERNSTNHPSEWPHSTGRPSRGSRCLHANLCVRRSGLDRRPGVVRLCPGHGIYGPMGFGGRMTTSLEQSALQYLRTATADANATFRDDQWPAIEALVRHKKRLLVVRRTGWGKSIVYFVATALMRQQGSGPTLIISPLLALMRNQLEAARRLGLRSERIDSTNPSDWDRIYKEIEANRVDLLLVSPERLFNETFRERASTLLARLGMLVVDEAHCISDWGHDFRPHYRLIANFIQFLPRSLPMLATTATADDTVVADVRNQLGANVEVSRGRLGRDSLYLDVYGESSYAARLAWLASTLPRLPGSGIVYALTKRDANVIADWLRFKGINALPYHGGTDDADREPREQALLKDEVKALVATSALGMGFDKPNLGFVVHFQGAQSIIHYYQQVGRAGRALERAYCILLLGNEDGDIVEHFVRNALPPQELVTGVLKALHESVNGLSISGLMAVVNKPKGRIEAAIEFLELQVPSPITKSGTKYSRTAVPYSYPIEQTQQLAARRRAERTAMVQYAEGRECLMQILARGLGDNTASACGRCSVCSGKHLVEVGDLRASTAEAEDFLTRSEIKLSTKKRWPEGGLPTYGFGSNTLVGKALEAQEGRALAFFQIGTVGQRLRAEKYEANHFSDESVAQAAELISRWNPQPRPEWIAPMVSRGRPDLVPSFTRRLAERLGIRYVEPLRKVHDTPPQKGMENNSFRARNLDGSLEVIPFPGMDRPGLFVDDMYDSGMTIAVAVALLRRAGAGPVFPFTLSKASERE